MRQINSFITTSYIMSLIIAFANFINAKSFLIIFTKLVNAWEHRICICFQQWQYVFLGEIPVAWPDLTLPWPIENQRHLQKPIMNKVLVWVSLDPRLKQTKKSFAVIPKLCKKMTEKWRNPGFLWKWLVEKQNKFFSWFKDKKLIRFFYSFSYC